METEISGRARNMELVKIINWIPKVWHHLNRFLEAHSSSDVTIGRWEVRQAGAGCWADGVGSGLPRTLAPSCTILWVLARTALSQYVMLSPEIKKKKKKWAEEHLETKMNPGHSIYADMS